MVLFGSYHCIFAMHVRKSLRVVDTKNDILLGALHNQCNLPSFAVFLSAFSSPYLSLSDSLSFFLPSLLACRRRKSIMNTAICYARPWKACTALVLSVLLPCFHCLGFLICACDLFIKKMLLGWQKAKKKNSPKKTSACIASLASFIIWNTF